MTRKEAVRLAADAGFAGRGIFRAEDLRFLEEVRDMCRADKCGNYGRLWTCPPACGTLDEIRARTGRFAWGIVLQTTEFMEDEFDGEAIENAQETQRERFTEYCGFLRDAGEDFFPMGSGGCGQCGTCTFPDAPCRFPDKAFPSMEACGLLVTDVCRIAGTPYYYGKNTVTFTACVLFPETEAFDMYGNHGE